MSNEQQDPRPEEPPSESLDARGRTRRRLSKAALGTAPVLMTLHSRPLKAGANCSISGWVSGNTSQHHDLKMECGRSPGYWGNQGNGGANGDHSGWKDGEGSKKLSDRFDFDSTYYIAGTDEEATLAEAVQTDSHARIDGIGDKRQLLRHGTAAYLNSFYDKWKVHHLDKETVKLLFESAINGTSVQISGESLTSEQSEAFLFNLTSKDQAGWW